MPYYLLKKYMNIVEPTKVQPVLHLPQQIFDFSNKSITKIEYVVSKTMISATIYSDRPTCTLSLKARGPLAGRFSIVTWENGAFSLTIANDRYQAHVYKLYHESKKNDRVYSSIASMIDSLIVAALQPTSILFELIQNAKDAPKEDQPIDIEIWQEDDWLVFAHNGREFTDDDVTSLSSAAQSTKTGDVDATGHKGIGFKALFSVSDCVYVLSKRYKFSFQKEHAGWVGQTKQARYPWQIIPIPVEANPLETIDDEKISYAIRLRSSKEAQECQEALKQFSMRPEVCLFIKNIRSITVGATKIFENCSQCIEVSETIDIPDELERANVLPEKFKEAKNVTLSFAFCQDEARALTAKNGCTLYSALPSEENIGLPFYVNASFYLDNSRTKLHTNGKEWNSFLIESIAYSQFVAFINVGAPPEIGRLLVHPDKVRFSCHQERFQEAYRRGFLRAIQSLAFIPTLSGTPLTLKETIFDPFGFVAKFGTDEEKKRLPHPDFQLPKECQETLTPYARYDFATIEKSLNERPITEPKKVAELIGFLYEQQKELPESFKELSIFISDTGKRRSADDIALPLKALGYRFEALNRQFLHREIYEALSATQLEWLNSFFKLAEPELASLILRINNAEDLDDKLAIVVCAFRLWADKKLSEDALKELQKLSIKTSDRFVTVSECYVADIYSPRIGLSRLIQKELLVSAEYASQLEKSELKGFGLFLAKIGVHNFPNGLFFEKVTFQPDKLANEEFVQELLRLPAEENVEQLIRSCKLSSKVYLTTKASQLVIAERCYLPDAFKPEEPMEKALTTLPFVDTARYKGLYREFLLDLGVHESVAIKVVHDIPAIDFVRGGNGRDKTYLRANSKYFAFLDFARYRELGWSGWEVRKLHGYVHFPFAEELKKTDLFWGIVKKYIHALHDADLRYKSCKIAEAKRSPVRFHLQNAVLGSDGAYYDPRHFVSPSHNEMIGGALITAKLPCTFTNQEYEFLGFRTNLTGHEALQVLGTLSERAVELNTKKRWISQLYKWILKDKYLFRTAEEISSNFLSRVRQLESQLTRWFDWFDKAKKERLKKKINEIPALVTKQQEDFKTTVGPFLTSNFTFVLRENLEDQNSIWKPDDISAADFSKLCALFNVSYYPPLSNDELGKRGEDGVYEHLKQRYAPVEETASGFTSAKATVIWHRKFSASLRKEGRVDEANTHLYYECDFTITRKEKPEKRLEVKSSRVNLEGVFSKKELALMNSAKRLDLVYKIYHIRLVHMPVENWTWKKVSQLSGLCTEMSGLKAEAIPLKTEVKDVKISFENIANCPKPFVRQAPATEALQTQGITDLI